MGCRVYVVETSVVLLEAMHAVTQVVLAAYLQSVYRRVSVYRTPAKKGRGEMDAVMKTVPIAHLQIVDRRESVNLAPAKTCSGGGWNSSLS